MFIMGNYKKCIILNISSLLPYVTYNKCILYYIHTIIPYFIHLSKTKKCSLRISTSFWCHTLLPFDCTVYNFPFFLFFINVFIYIDLWTGKWTRWLHSCLNKTVIRNWNWMCRTVVIFFKFWVWNNKFLANHQRNT